MQARQGSKQSARLLLLVLLLLLLVVLLLLLVVGGRSHARHRIASIQPKLLLLHLCKLLQQRVQPRSQRTSCHLLMLLLLCLLLLLLGLQLLQHRP